MNYLKRVKLSAVVMLLLISAILLAATPVLATPSSDCIGISPFQSEAILVRNYTQALYNANYMYNSSEYSILNYSLPYADIWFFSGHGYEDWRGKNCLKAGDGYKIWPREIPDLNGTQFPEMRFAYASACYAGDSDWWQNDLPEAFLGHGAKAYMGWHGSVNGPDAYDFTNMFYHLTIDRGYRVWDAAAAAEKALGVNIDCHGENVRLIP